MSDAIESTIKSRSATHGTFREVARLTDAAVSAWSTGRNWLDLEPYQRVALCEMAHKIARVLSGDPNFLDHWRDLIGYPTLVAGYLEEEPEADVPIDLATFESSLRESPTNESRFSEVEYLRAQTRDSLGRKP